jgi:hypothetical protein
MIKGFECETNGFLLGITLWIRDYELRRTLWKKLQLNDASLCFAGVQRH